MATTSALPMLSQRHQPRNSATRPTPPATFSAPLRCAHRCGALNNRESSPATPLLLLLPLAVPEGSAEPVAEGLALVLQRVRSIDRGPTRLRQRLDRLVVEVALDVPRRDVGDLITVHEP